jgi:hypothetical protein
MLSMSRSDAGVDLQLEALRLARTRPAVLKLELARARSENPLFPIFVFEGDDDKIVYGQWIRRIAPDVKYVMFPCSGKGQLLGLRSSLHQDKTGLSKQIWFFVDRDFDDLRGQPDGVDIFMTEKYSVENYLVDGTVLDNILEIEFHCHTSPEVRTAVRKLFDDCYDSFLSETSEINYRLFIARRLGIDVGHLPDAIGKIAKVELHGVSVGSLTATAAVRFVDDPDESLVTPLKAEFQALPPRDRYRGKFALLFFNCWIHMLAERAKDKSCSIFGPAKIKSKVRIAELSITGFASRSPLPVGLQEFVGQAH